MSRLLSALLTLLNLAQAILTYLREKRIKDEGRKEVLTEQEQVNEEAHDRSLEIDADGIRLELDALRERMRDYQRTDP